MALTLGSVAANLPGNAGSIARFHRPAARALARGETDRSEEQREGGLLHQLNMCRSGARLVSPRFSILFRKYGDAFHRADQILSVVLDEQHSRSIDWGAKSVDEAFRERRNAHDSTWLTKMEHVPDRRPKRVFDELMRGDID